MPCIKYIETTLYTSYKFDDMNVDRYTVQSYFLVGCMGSKF